MNRALDAALSAVGLAVAAPVLGAAAAAIAPAAQALTEIMATLDRRGKQARTEGLAALRELHDTLTAVEQRLRRTA